MSEQTEPRTDLHTLAVVERASRTKQELCEGKDMHFFTISVTVRGFGCDYENSEFPFTVVERAHNLRDAVTQAAARPLNDWCEAQVKVVRDEDHEIAMTIRSPDE